MRPQLFIEKIMPVKLLNQQVYYEHGGNPFKGLHRWYSRKPLSFSRACILASLLPAHISMEDFLYVMGIYGEDERKFWENSDKSDDEKDKLRNIKEVRLYKCPPNDKQINLFEELCEQVWGTKNPAILDQFGGGGSIPFEAVRYGLNVFTSDLNPVAVIIMKAAMEFPLKFGKDLQFDIDKWVNFVGNEAEKRLADFFPSSTLSPLEGQGGESVQNYLWAHTVICPSCSCNSVIPLSPNWWLYKRPEKQNLHKWCAVKPIPNPDKKRVDFELIKGEKGKGTTIQTDSGDFNPDDFATIGRGVGKCCNCGNIIEDDIIKKQAQNEGLGHQLYAVAFKQGKGSLEFRLPNENDLEGVNKVEQYLQENLEKYNVNQLIPDIGIINGEKTKELIRIGIEKWSQLFNPRQLLTLVTYIEIINDAKLQILAEYELEKAQAIITYLTLVFDRCIDANCRLVIYNAGRACIQKASTQHALNLMWNYPEVNGAFELWESCREEAADFYTELCEYFNKQTLGNNQKNQPSLGQLELNIETNNNEQLELEVPLTKGDLGGSKQGKMIPPSPPLKGGNQISNGSKGGSNAIKINLESADSLYHLSDKSIEAIITDPPYYGTIQYAELSDFFYSWQKRILGDIFPELFWQELTDKDREAVANPSRFRNMGESPDELAKRDYEGKMAMVWNEAYRVLKDEGVLTVQFNHKDSGAWDTLAKALIDAGFQITASWAVSTENPQNLHQAKKNSVSSTVILVCRKRDTNAPQAWWDDLRPEVANLVEARAPEFEDNDIDGINLYLSAFGPALNVFSKSYPILDSAGEEVRPEVAFAEARKAIASYRFRKLLQTDTAGFDALTQWYLLAWDAFSAREFPFDEARQLALAIGGFNVNDLARGYKLIDSTSGTCKFLTPQQRLKKRAFTVNPQDFTMKYLIDGLHALIAVYEDEENLEAVRQFLKKTGLNSNDLLTKCIEIAFKVIPDSMKEKQTLINLWLGIDEIKSKVQYFQSEVDFN